MLFSSARRIRLVPILLALLAALMFAPSAFARGHHSNWSVNLGFAGPGYSIGYSDCRHCGRGYVSGNFYGGYSGYNGGYASYYGGYGGGYYASSYYPTYYNSYYPSYGAVYYNNYPSHRRSPRYYRPVTRRVVYSNSYYNDDRRDSRRYRDDRHRNADRYDNDRGYSRRAAYYDRRN